MRTAKALRDRALYLTASQQKDFDLFARNFFKLFLLLILVKCTQWFPGGEAFIPSLPFSDLKTKNITHSYKYSV